MCIRKNSCCLHKKNKRRYSPIYRLFLTHFQHPVDAKTWHQEASKHTQVGSITATSPLKSGEPKFLFQGCCLRLYSFGQRCKGVFLLSKCDCVELSTEPNIWNPDYYCFSSKSQGFSVWIVAEVFLSSFSEELRPMPREESKHISGNPKCQVLPHACISKRAGKNPRAAEPSSTSWSSPSQGRSMSAPLL